MNIERVEKKLREARFFLDKMRGWEARAVGDKEPYDFFMSAFLSAARSVDYRLRHEQGATYGAWRDAWDKRNPTEASLIKFIVDDRNLEVHAGGSVRDARMEDIEILGNEYEDASGKMTVFGPPDMPRPVVRKAAYYFTVAGAEQRATETCQQCVGLLDRIVAEFKRDHP